jgi:Fe-S cluster assembly protein SufD
MDISRLTALAEENIKTTSENLHDFQKTHLHLFSQKGFQAKDPEFYQYSNLKSYFEGMDLSDGSSEQMLPQIDSPTVVFENGKLLSNTFSAAGVEILSLKEHFSEVSALFHSDNPLTHLHHALLSEGILIKIKKNTEVASALRIVYLNTKPGVSALSVVVKAEANSHFSFSEETIGVNNTYAQMTESLVFLENGAQVEHVQLEKGTHHSLHHGDTFAQVNKDAVYRNVVLQVGGKMNRRNMRLHLTHPGAHGESYNLFLTGESEISDINTVIHHLAADTTSDQLAKGILDGDSRGIFTGKIHIHPKAQRVASAQLNRNLLLSKKAQVHSQPQLEIFADDVKCSHGSTTGQMSDDELFYFEARGIPEDRARTLLAHGFGMEVVLKIKNKEIRNRTEELVHNILQEKFHLGGV